MSLYLAREPFQAIIQLSHLVVSVWEQGVKGHQPGDNTQKFPKGFSPGLGQGGLGNALTVNLCHCCGSPTAPIHTCSLCPSRVQSWGKQGKGCDMGSFLGLEQLNTHAKASRPQM